MVLTAAEELNMILPRWKTQSRPGLWGPFQDPECGWWNGHVGWECWAASSLTVFAMTKSRQCGLAYIKTIFQSATSIKYLKDWIIWNELPLYTIIFEGDLPTSTRPGTRHFLNYWLLVAIKLCQTLMRMDISWMNVTGYWEEYLEDWILDLIYIHWSDRRVFVFISVTSAIGHV